MKVASFIREAAADFWLNLLFWQTSRYPAAVVACKPLFLRLAWNFASQMRHNTLCNARRVLGEGSTARQHEALAKAVIGNFYDFVCEIGLSYKMSRQQLLDRVATVEGHERYLAARADKKGAIILTAHLGSFEVGMAALLEYEKRIHVLFRRDKFQLFERMRASLRKRLGIVEAHVDDGLPVWIRLRDALSANEVVLVQGDRVMAGQRGRAVRFLGGTMLLPIGPIKLAMVTGAPLVPIFSIRQPDRRIALFVEEPIRVLNEAEIDLALQRIGRVLDRYISKYPDQWLVLHRAWCEDVE